ncbi:MAG: hypothetical protein PUI38_05735, partial [Candidatus Treponema excrementipullorum]|nr:hypothetical protein [Candidatus Treponema excrementipullorum]
MSAQTPAFLYLYRRLCGKFGGMHCNNFVAFQLVRWKVSGQTHVKIFCFKSLNYYLKNAKNGKIPLGGVMLLRESLEEIDDFRV